MPNQRKCHACGKWTDTKETSCIFCDTTLDPALRAAEERAEQKRLREENRLLNESAIERYLRKLESSEKWHHRWGFKILSVAFTIYMGILSFFIWLIALLSG